jgi:colicin import membrane protein
MTLRKIFSLPVFLSVFLHAGLVALLIFKLDLFKKEPEPYRPHFVTATLVDINPKAKAAPQQPKEQVLEGKNNPELKQVRQQQEQERQEAEAKMLEQKVEEKKQKEEEQRQENLKQDKAKKAAEEKAKAEQEKKLEEEQKQKTELDKKKKREQQAKDAQKALDAALQKEEQMISSQVDDVSTKTYDELIAERVSQNWSRPPSAVKGMVTVLEIKMLPTGQVVGVRVVKSSGDAAFDRSAEQAVKKVDRFEEVKNIPPVIFEKKYRQFTFTFNPEDLRR